MTLSPVFHYRFAYDELVIKSRPLNHQTVVVFDVRPLLLLDAPFFIPL